MGGSYTQDQVSKRDAMTKALNKDIDWVSIRRREFLDAAYALAEVSSGEYMKEVFDCITGEMKSGR